LALWFLLLERGRFKKPPALTVPQVRALFSELLREPCAEAATIARRISRVLRRSEEARIYHWHQATGELPPTHPPHRPARQKPSAEQLAQ
jgi:hypothetical protein